MSWVKISDLTTGGLKLPKDAILVPPGMKPPDHYRFCYTTQVPSFNYINGENLAVPPASYEPFSTREELHLDREVWVPLTGDE